VAGDPAVVRIRAQPCERPTRSLGVGTVVGHGLVLTAAHVVEGRLRSLTVDGRPGTVVALDPRRDLALVATETSARRPARLAAGVPAGGTAARALLPDGHEPVTVLRAVRLRVTDATRRTIHERRSVVVSPALPRGTSGAPVVDDDGRVLGIVVLSRPRSGVADAVAHDEVSDVVARGREASLVPPPGCA